MINLSDHDKRVLSNIGHAPYGRELAEIIDKMKKQICSLESMSLDRDYGPQVEGRLLFRELADELIKRLSYKEKHGSAPIRAVDFET